MHKIVSFDVLEAFYNRGFVAYDEIRIDDMSSATRDRSIRKMVNLGLIERKPYTNLLTGKSYNKFKITQLGRNEFRRERLLRMKK